MEWKNPSSWSWSSLSRSCREKIVCVCIKYLPRRSFTWREKEKKVRVAWNRCKVGKSSKCLEEVPSLEPRLAVCKCHPLAEGLHTELNRNSSRKFYRSPFMARNHLAFSIFFALHLTSPPNDYNLLHSLKLHASRDEFFFCFARFFPLLHELTLWKNRVL